MTDELPDLVRAHRPGMRYDVYRHADEFEGDRFDPIYLGTAHTTPELTELYRQASWPMVKVNVFKPPLTWLTDSRGRTHAIEKMDPRASNWLTLCDRHFWTCDILGAGESVTAPRCEECVHRAETWTP